MTNRKLIVIIICILLIAVGLLSLYFIKDMLSNRNNAVINTYKPDQQDEKLVKPSSTPESISEKSKTNEKNPINQSANLNSNGDNVLANTTDSSPNSSENGTDNNETDNEGSSSTPVPSPEPKSNNSDNKDPNSIDIAITPTPIPSKNVMKLLFLGIDRTEARESNRRAFASDTIMLARIDPDNKKIKVLSIPRDTYAYLPVTGKMDKINYAYTYGSLQGKAIRSVREAITGLLGEDCNFDYYFTLEMEPVPDIIDEMGGVEVNVEIDMHSHGVDISQGLQMMDGKTAYDYIRWRYADDGDIGRIRRQQGFLKAVLNKMKASDVKKEFLRIVIDYDKYIDTDLGLEQIETLSNTILSISDENIQFYTLPGEGEMIDDISYWILNETGTKEIIAKFLMD